MSRLDRYQSWWQPLPAWLKLVNGVAFYPAWLFIVYCVLTGAPKSRAALVAFAICLTCVVLHLVFDRRNRAGEQEQSEFDFFGGE